MPQLGTLKIFPKGLLWHFEENVFSLPFRFLLSAFVLMLRCVDLRAPCAGGSDHAGLIFVPRFGKSVLALPLKDVSSIQKAGALDQKLTKGMLGAIRITIKNESVCLLARIACALALNAKYQNAKVFVQQFLLVRRSVRHPRSAVERDAEEQADLCACDLGANRRSASSRHARAARRTRQREQSDCTRERSKFHRRVRSPARRRRRVLMPCPAVDHANASSERDRLSLRSFLLLHLCHPAQASIPMRLALSPCDQRRAR
jgi:hypothetical protein